MQRIQDMFINMEEVAEDAYKNTELLLSQYTKVMFRIEKNLVDIDYEMYAEEGKHLKEMLYDLVDFDATAEKRRIQEKLLNYESLFAGNHERFPDSFEGLSKKWTAVLSAFEI
jgi:hypothetical protein